MQTKKANKWEPGRGSKEFASRLRYVMGEKEISQSSLIALAQEKLDMQLNKGAVSDWYNGKKKPQIKNVCILASVLECNRIWLEAGIDDPFPIDFGGVSHGPIQQQHAGENAAQATHNSMATLTTNGADGINLSPLEQEIISLLRELGTVAARGVKGMLEKRLEEERESWNR